MHTPIVTADRHRGVLGVYFESEHASDAESGIAESDEPVYVRDERRRAAGRLLLLLAGFSPIRQYRFYNMWAIEETSRGTRARQCEAESHEQGAYEKVNVNDYTMNIYIYSVQRLPSNRLLGVSTLDWQSVYGLLTSCIRPEIAIKI